MSNGKAPPLTASAIVAKPAVSGSHILKIDGYSHTKGLGNGRCIDSGEFTVAGHRWRLQYYPDGDRSGHDDSISILLVPVGSSGVEARYKVTLLDQDGNAVLSYSIACTYDSWWPDLQLRSELIKRKDLEESVYPKNDSFSVRCDVTVEKEIFNKAMPVPVARPGNKKETADH